MPFFGSLAGLFGRVLLVAAAVVYLFSEISTLVGSGLPGFFDGSVRFNNPFGVAVDSEGNVYVADYTNNRIRKITSAGVVTTLAGSGVTSSVNGTGINATFNGPRGLAVDSLGNVYVGENGHLIRKISPTGVVTTLAGSGIGGGNGAFADGTGVSASFAYPTGVAVDSSGTVYVADQLNNRIRKITSGGVVTTFAGNGGTTFTDGTGTNATFNSPSGVAVDSNGNVYVGDNSNNRIRKITPAGVVTTLAGQTTAGSTNGTGTNASFTNPYGIAVDSIGNVYAAEVNGHRIRKITSAGVVTTLAGSGTATFADGTGTNASFNVSQGVTVDSSGTLYLADQQNQRIRKITPAGLVSTFAGSGVAGFTDSVTPYLFNRPTGIAFDSAGNLYVADRDNRRIRRITPTGVISTFAGSATQAVIDGTGTNASFTYPYVIALSSEGIIYVSEYTGQRIRKITPAGVVTTFAGQTTIGSTDGIGTNATFNHPNGLAVDSAGNLYVTDRSNHRIRKITPEGVVTTFAGSAGGSGIGAGSSDGTGTNASFNFPEAIAVDSAGTVYVADTSNHRIRKITAAGVVTTLAGSSLGSTDATGTNATFNFPQGITFDSVGNLYVGDTNNHRIRRITAAGVVTTLAGSSLGSTDATGTNARFNYPFGIAFDSVGNLYVADAFNHRIRKITSAAVVTTIAGSTAGYSDGGWFTIPVGVGTDWDGTVYVADTNNHRIRKITPAGVVSTFAGSGTAGATNATGNGASFNLPQGVALDSAGNVYVADSTNRRIRRITSAGVVTTFAGSATSGFADGTGTSATFNTPVGITVDPLGIVYVSDIGNHNIRRITAAGVVTSLAGSRTATFADGVGTNASFNTPSGIVADIYGNVYVADTNNHRIRRVTSDGTVTTLAGSTAGYADGTGTNAQFNFPYHLSIDALGTLYVADQTNNRIRTVQTSTGVVSTLAGDGTAGFTPSRFNTPQGITIDRFRNAYVADTNNHSIRKIPNVYTLPENNAVVTTVAGDGTNGFIDANGIGARFSNPFGVAVDSVGTMYVTDTGNHLIRKITPQGLITTFAGNRTAASTDGTGTNASINTPQGIAIDSEGNLYVGEREGYRIRKITPGGVVTTFAGTTFGYLDGTGVDARFNDPNGIALDSAKNVYVTDVRNYCIRKITPAGVVSTLAGQINPGFLDGTGTNAQFDLPWGITVDSAGTVYVADALNNRIRKITPAGVVTTFAGDGTSGFLDGTGTNTKFSYPNGLEVDLADNIYVADYGNHRIRKITPAGVVTTLAGQTTGGFQDGTGTNARFNGPGEVTMYSTGTMYVIERINNRIRKIGTTVPQLPLNRGAVTTLAGSTSRTSGFVNATGTSASFNFPQGVAVDSTGNVYVADANNQRIRRITPTGVVTTFAGSGTATFGNGTGAGASFNYPNGVALDSSGTVYIADTLNNRIRKITPAGVVSTFAGQGTGGFQDGTGTNAYFNFPIGIVVDSAGTVYVGENGNHRIRKITPAGVVTTLAGSGIGAGYAGTFANGTGTNASFSNPRGVAVDTSGTVYVSDMQNNRIRKITPGGVVTTFAGQETGGFQDGTGTNAMFYAPIGMVMDSVGNMYVGDSVNNRIRKITPLGVVTTLAGSATYSSFYQPAGTAVDSGGIVYVADGLNHCIQKIQ